MHVITAVVCVRVHACTRARLHAYTSSSMHFRCIKASSWDCVLCHTEKGDSNILLFYSKFYENSLPQWAVILLRDASMVQHLVTGKARTFYFILESQFLKKLSGINCMSV